LVSAVDANEYNVDAWPAPLPGAAAMVFLEAKHGIVLS
jgi:hypothetical protein